MSSRAPVELDFLGLRATAAATAGEHHNKNSSFIRGMETSAIARIDPQLLRRVIARPPPPPPAESTAPMTLFYNGSVAAFDVSHDKAKAIIQMATEVMTPREGRSSGSTLVGNFVKDMPLARTTSLHRFLQKRKERLTRLGPYQLGGPGDAAAAGATTTSATSCKYFHVKKEAEEPAELA